MGGAALRPVRAPRQAGGAPGNPRPRPVRHHLRPRHRGLPRGARRRGDQGRDAGAGRRHPHPRPRGLLLEGRLRRVLPSEPRQVSRRRRHAPRRGPGSHPEARRPRGRPRRELQARHDRGEVGPRVPPAAGDQPAADLRREHRASASGGHSPRAARPTTASRRPCRGLSAISGFEGALPIKSGNYLGDWFGACLSALGVLAALRWRDRTGEGQFVEMAQCEGLVRALDWTWLYAGLTGRDRPKTGNRDPVFVPSGIYACQDGHVAIVAGKDAGVPRSRGGARARRSSPTTRASRRPTPDAARLTRTRSTSSSGPGARGSRGPTSRRRRGGTDSPPHR